MSTPAILYNIAHVRGKYQSGRALYFLPLGGNLPCKTNATVIVDKHHAPGIIFSQRDSFMRPGTAPDKVRAVVNLLQVFNFLGWQKSGHDSWYHREESYWQYPASSRRARRRGALGNRPDDHRRDLHESR